MTSEVCIMNRRAAVLAADSATTVRNLNGATNEIRYFKGANKIFQLSNFAPVGLMIYNAADVLHVPWEVVVKEFRSSLGKKTFNELREYASEFFAYLSGNLRLFPEEIQKQVFLIAAVTSAAQMINRASDSSPDNALRRAALEREIQALSDKLAQLPFHASIDEAAVLNIPESWHQEIRAKLLSFSEASFYPDDLQQICQVAVESVVKLPSETLPMTGLVFTGFGDTEIFPTMHEYHSFGVILGRHVADLKATEKIDHETPASLKAFAQTSMTDTFTVGFSEGVFFLMNLAIRAGLKKLTSDLLNAAAVDAAAVPNADEIIEDARSAICDELMSRARREHAFPLRNVLGVLPIEEMSELAETMIKLQSLKEKVTKPSETVGGPVDVAVITRAEGLVWLRRKHFFDSAINSRYLQRQEASYK